MLSQNEEGTKKIYYLVFRERFGKKSGGDGTVDTPVPIPNTEVKHRSGEGIQLVGENSALPGFFLFFLFIFLLLFYVKKL